MKRTAITITVAACLILIIGGFTRNGPFTTEVQKGFRGVQNHEQLLKEQSFGFAIMADEHGATPINSPHSMRAMKWMKECDTRFVFALGDMEKGCSGHSFVEYAVTNDWFRKSYYPTIGDTEDLCFYEDMGMGDSTGIRSGELYFKLMNMYKRQNVYFNPNNKVEYHAVFQEGNVKLHFISLYFTDEHHGNLENFSAESKQYLLRTLQGIDKDENTFILVAAHTAYGDWVQYLKQSHQEYVLAKVDLLLSGGVHYFSEFKHPYYEKFNGLIISAGSISKPRWGSYPGYIQVHVFENPSELVVQFVNLQNESAALCDTPYSYIKAPLRKGAQLVF